MYFIWLYFCFVWYTPLLASELKSNSIAAMQSCLLSKGFSKKDIVIRDQTSNRKKYNYLNYQFNRNYGEKTPLAYILPSQTSDVQHSVLCARLFGIRVVAKSGGFSYAKYSFGDSETVVIDLRKMDYVSVNSRYRTADLGSGNLLGRVTEELLRYDYFFPIGLCPWVGIAYSLGGGYSFMSRRYGVALDHLIELEMVDSTGFIHIANKRKNSDLFWALRGGGIGGSFGIVTRFKFKLTEIPKQVIYARNNYPLVMFPQLFDAFQTYCKANPSRVFNVIMTTVDKNILVELIEIITKDATYRPALFKKVLRRHFPATEDSTIRVLTYGDFIRIAGPYGDSPQESLGNITRSDYGPIHFKAKSFYAPNVVGKSEVSQIDALMQRAPKYIVFEFQANGGAINDIGARQTAYVHRKQNIYILEMEYLAPLNRTTTDDQAAMDWLREFFEVTKALMNHTESYVNNSDEELTDYLQRYYGTNLRRLRKIKTKYDPENYFKQPQSIPPKGVLPK